MKTGEKGIELIKSFESLHDGDLTIIGLQPKMCPAGIWTEGYGRAMRDSKGAFIKGKENKSKAYENISVNNAVEAEKALSEDLKTYERIVISRVKVQLTQNEFDALVSFTYNTGGSTTVFNMLNRSEKPEVLRSWFESHYIRGGGKVLNGLIRRRKAEMDLFFSKL